MVTWDLDWAWMQIPLQPGLEEEQIRRRVMFWVELTWHYVYFAGGDAWKKLNVAGMFIDCLDMIRNHPSLASLHHEAAKLLANVFRWGTSGSVWRKYAGADCGVCRDRFAVHPESIPTEMCLLVDNVWQLDNLESKQAVRIVSYRVRPTTA